MDSSREIEKFIKKYDLEKYLEGYNYWDMEIKILEKDSYLMMSGMDKRKLYLFVDGLLKVTLLSSEGDEMLLELTKPFDILGDVEFLLEEDVHYNIQIKERSTFLELDFDKAVKNIRFYELMAKTLAKKLRNTSKKYSVKKLCTSRVLVAKFITENRKYFSSTIKYGDISKLLGLSERQLRRILKDFEDKGLIERKGRKIDILDEEGIKRLTS
ncbi:Crp/Fnr family transcriptional regulator [uncultured Ilyobacter sp.]|uniref:Crp/Fnr family transcriptional regulator n=1 Tax=uncultured Ilyobacter sp. TaxID=544433 RepID=UPI002AA75A97|nr:Crp/Fnr family transcriptional regulator [uncultured Ilyobacter sp.]